MGPAPDRPVEAVLPAEPQPQQAPLSLPAEPSGPAPERPVPGWWRERAARPEHTAGPSLPWAIVSTFLVLALLAIVLWLLKRFLWRSRFLGEGGPLEILARRALDGSSRLYLVRVGRRVVLVGATRERICALAEIADPQEAAAVRADAGGADSVQEAFRTRLREGIEAYERGERDGSPEPLERIETELDQIRQTVQSWRT